MINLNFILELFKNNFGALILLIALSIIISFEIMVYVESIRYILVGVLLSGLVFLGLGILFYGYTSSYLYAILALFVAVIFLFLGTYVIFLIIFLLYLFDILIIEIVYFSASIYSIWTWVIAIAVAIVMYFIIKQLNKILNKKLFLLDSEIKKNEKRDSHVRNRNKSEN
ncbi:MAG: hypothetical protein ACP5F1_05900 [Thermoplasmata archaeon]|nr:hypothetical protein [Thermoplasmata archaeon]